jgi:hypothetical protein
VPGTRCGAMMDASKLGAGFGARHLLWGGRMLANWGLDRCQAPVAVWRPDASKVGSGSVPGTCCGRMDASKHGSRLVPGTRCGGGGC